MAATDKNMTFDVNLLPATTGDHNLGSSELKWKINGVADPKLTDTNTWRGIQDNLTSSSNTTESLSAKQGYLLANGSARDNTKVAKVTSTDNAIVRFNGAGGEVQNSGVIIDDGNNVTIPGTALKVTAEAGEKYILIGNQNNQGVDCPVVLQGVNGSLYIGNGTSWNSNTGGTLNTALYMSKERKIGIGTINPVTELDVNGTATALTYKITSNATITYNSTSGCVEIIV